MPEIFNPDQQIIYQEMMAHPVLFTHKHPKKVAVVGEDHLGIIREVLKHPAITEIWQTSPLSSKEPKLKHLSASAAPAYYFDVIILTAEKTPHPLSIYHQILHNDGVLLYQSTSPFELKKLKAQYQQLKSIGFSDIQVLNFPQPNYPTGWRAALLATKCTPLKRISEKDIFNRPFKTQYYNFDVHKASLALPEFMREELTA